MSAYLTRIELHSATESNYTVLHNHMRAKGFTTTIVADNGVTYHLPPAEYYCISDQPKTEILNTAKMAVQQTGLNATIFVTVSNGWISHNLKPA